MAEGKKLRVMIRQIYETTAFDPERGVYRAVAIRVELPGGIIRDILIPADEYNPELVDHYIREWWSKYGKWLGKQLEMP